MRRRPSTSSARSKRRSSRKRSRSGCSIADMAGSRSSPITPKSPPRDALLLLIARASGDGALGALRIEALPEADWVTLSQGKRGPVAAGRFLVHGSHDRGRVATRTIHHRDRRGPSLRHGAPCLDARLPARARRHSQAAASAQGRRYRHRHRNPRHRRRQGAEAKSDRERQRPARGARSRRRMRG